MHILFETAWGKVGAEADGHAVTRIYLPGCVPAGFATAKRPSRLLRAVKTELREYFAGTRREFDIALEPGGTDFLRAVWAQVLKIPYGKVKTYGDIAGELGNPDAVRAVGMASGRNPLPILIPCHRLVGDGNRLIGYGGGGIDVKRRLIEHERAGSVAKKIVVGVK